MKKAVACVALAGAMLLVSMPQVRRQIADAAASLMPARQQSAGTQASEYTLELGEASATDMVSATLYYRYGETEVLGAQRVQLDIRREETIAMRTVTLLVEGPSPSRERLRGVFPSGTRVLSVSGDGSIAHVTLSMEFLGAPDDAPEGWEDSAAWREEAALRRRLGVQSIVAALTENGRYQRVQIYVAQTDDDVPQRIPLAALEPSVEDAALVLAACPRDESVILTAQRAMEMAMQAWMARDWAALYALLLPDGDGELPTLAAFETQMREADATLLDYEVSPGQVDIGGARATLVVSATAHTAGGEASIVRESVPVERWQDNWAVSAQTMLSLMVRD